MIKILLDSACDYTMDEIREKDFATVPLRVTFGDRSYIPGEELDNDTFYEMLTQGKEFPKTSQPSPQDFLNHFEKAKENGDELLCLLLSSGISGTCQSAALAKSMADYDKIYIIDTMTATCPIRVLADHALTLIEQGMAAADIAAQLEQLKSRVKVTAAVDTLEYLCRGGRVSRAAAAIGEMANLKPIITVTPEGTVGVMGKCFGRNKAISALLKNLQEQELDSSFPMYTLYTCGTDNCDRFESKLTQAGYSTAGRVQIGSVIGTHVGPDVFGVVYVTK